MTSTMICKSSVVTSQTLCQAAGKYGKPVDLIINVYKSTSPLIHHRMKLYIGNFVYEILIFGLNYANFHFVTSSTRSLDEIPCIYSSCSRVVQTYPVSDECYKCVYVPRTFSHAHRSKYQYKLQQADCVS